jgi:hypothetical protein
MTRIPDAGSTNFQVRVGVCLVDCAVQDEALGAVSGLTVAFSEALRQKSFHTFRTLINAAAELKLSTLPPGSSGRIVLTTEDLRCVQPEPGVPPFGSSSRALTRAASLSAGVPASASSDAASRGSVT